MEYLLHYTWKHKLFPLRELRTTGGQLLEVIDPGLYNHDAGPDFFNAKLKIDGTLWVGNVEIHQRSSDWYLHQHEANPVYDSVILHVVETNDRPVTRCNGEEIPTLLLSPPESVCQHYRELMQADEYPPCYSILPNLSKLKIHSFFSALQTERLIQKAERIESVRQQFEQNWEDAFFVTLARNFGFGVNGEAFEEWGKHIPLRAVDKHRDNLFQIEALFFGQAALLEEEIADDYYSRLQKEYQFLAHKFNLRRMEASRWRFLRLRPTNFPHVRLAQLAYLYFKGQGLLSRLLELEKPEEVELLFATQTSEYWETHYHFGKFSPRRTKRLSRNSIQLLIINTLAPFLYAYGRYRGEERFCLRAVAFLESLKAENNYIVRMWEQCGLAVRSAADSQALIQLKKNYCDTRKCLQCRFGYEYLRQKNTEESVGSGKI